MAKPPLKNRRKAVFQRFLSAGVLALALTACSESPSHKAASSAVAGTERLKVVASFSIAADLVQSLGGEQVEVFTLVKAGEDAHHFSLSATAAAHLETADLVVVNGLGFETWLPSWETSQHNARARILTLSQGLVPLGPASAPDPHAWHSPSALKLYARNLADALGQRAPQHRALFERRYRAFVAELSEIENQARSRLAQLKQPHQRGFATTHGGFAYLGRDFSLQVLALASADEHHSSAGELAQLIRSARQQQLRWLFPTEIPRAQLIRLSQEAGLKLAPALASDSLGAPDSATGNVLALMRHNLEVVINTLSEQR